MLTDIAARHAIANAINAGDAHHTQYDLDAIVAGLREATGGYDIEAMPHDDFWKLVQDNDLSAETITVRTIATHQETEQVIDTETTTRAVLPLADNLDLSAADLGCEPGSTHRIEAVTADGAVIDSYQTTAD